MHIRMATACTALLLALALLPIAPQPAAAQGAANAGFVPVTDAMLENPDPGDWLMWRRTQDSWGYSPLDQIDRDNVGELRMVWTRALREGTNQATPIAYGGVLYVPNPSHATQAIDARTGRPDLGVRAAHPGGRQRPHSGAGPGQPQRGHPRQPHHRHRQRRLPLRARRRDRPPGVGDGGPQPVRVAGAAFHRADHRQRPGGIGPELPAVGRTRSLHHRRPRPAHRRGALAHAPDPGAGRAGQRDVGRRAVRGARARGGRGWRPATTPS